MSHSSRTQRFRRASAGPAPLASPAYRPRTTPLEHALLARTTFGTSRGARARIAQVGAGNWVDDQLNHLALPQGDLEQQMQPFQWLGWSAAALRAGFTIQSAGIIRRETRFIRLVRATHSSAQLFERTVEFWNDHLHVPNKREEAIFLKPPYEEEVIRPHAFGSFAAMLLGSARNAAMLHYLDNESNVAGAPNENYARELMELHSLGVDGPYTEDDVREVARCFTGWTWEQSNSQGTFGEFRFDAASHDDGAKVVLGQTIPAGGGITDGQTVVHMLAAHPSTAQFLARKLCRWFLAYDPPQDIVDDAANAYLASSGHIAPMLRVILRPSSFQRVPPQQFPKLKRPFHMIVSAIRALELKWTDLTTAVQSLEPMGHQIYGWDPPDGYPDTVGAWAGGLLARWNWAAEVFGGQAGFFETPLSALQWSISHAPQSEWAEAIDAVLTDGASPPALLAQQQAFINGLPSNPESLREAFVVAASTPSFQLY